MAQGLRDHLLNWYETVFDLIDMRSFSNLWYWIGLAVIWSGASHWVIGVPYDLVLRARRQGGDTENDLNDLVRVNVNRILYIADTSGIWLLAISCFLLTTLALLGFVYGLEFGQALFLLAFPMTLVFALSIHTARGIMTADGNGLQKRLSRHRFITQAIGMVSIFITALWGMWHNMTFLPI